MAGIRRSVAPLGALEYLALRHGPDLCARYGVTLDRWTEHGAQVLGRVHPEDRHAVTDMVAWYGIPPGWTTEDAR